MANQKQVELLKQGAPDWNLWRTSNSEEAIDLSDARLGGAYLSRADLRGADLRRAILAMATVIGADLGEANLSEAILFDAHLGAANLSNANLSKAEISGVNFSLSNLSGANFSLSNLIGADLKEANLRGSNLSKAILVRLIALGANFTGVNLTGACIEDWHINADTNLEDVECDYIYLKYPDEERRPSDPNKNFEPGDFAKLVQKAFNTVDLIFRNGVDWEALMISLEKLRVEAEGAELSIQAIENKNDGAFVVRVNVPPEADKATVETYLKHEYELALKVLDERYRYELKAKDIEIASYRRENTNIMRLAEWASNRPIIVQAIATAESKLMSETFNTDLRGANVTNYANKLQNNARQQAILHNYAPEQRQTLAEAAAEIQQLLEQLSQSYPTTTQTEKMALVTKAVEEIERNPTLKARVIGALKAGSVETLKELIDNPLVNVLLAALEGWQEAE